MESLREMSLEQLCEMNGKARRLCALMKKGIVSFVFKKKSNGKIRKARGTLKTSLIPPELLKKKGSKVKRPEDSVVYYDTDKHAIRSFKDYLLKRVHKSSVLDPTKKAASDISKALKDVNSSKSTSSKEPKVNKSNSKKPSSASKKPSEVKGKDKK